MIPVEVRTILKVNATFKVRLLWILATLLFSLGVGCEAAGPDTGGETHFLRVCTEGDGTCGDQFECLCGVCTLLCDGSSICNSHANAECVSLSDIVQNTASEMCDIAPSSRVCELICEQDQDCRSISAAHRCLSGACRLTDGDTDGEGGSGSTGEDTEVSCSPSGVTPNEVVILGDTFLATTHQITAYLEALARQAGALEQGFRYRDYSRLAGNALAWMGEGILDQYQDAALDAQARVIIMNGGGADILLGNCENASPDCTLITDAAASFASLLGVMATDGVEHVIFVGYPDPVPPAVKNTMDLLRPLLVEVCASSDLPCHWVDLRDVFAGNYDKYVSYDGLNPTALGAEASAQAIWAIMERECIAH